MLPNHTKERDPLGAVSSFPDDQSPTHDVGSLSTACRPSGRSPHSDTTAGRLQHHLTVSKTRPRRQSFQHCTASTSPSSAYSDLGGQLRHIFQGSSYTHKTHMVCVQSDPPFFREDASLLPTFAKAGTATSLGYIVFRCVRMLYYPHMDDLQLGSVTLTG